LVQDAVARLQLELGPVCVDVEAVGVLVADKVGEGAALDRSGAAVALDHEHLIAVDAVDLVKVDVMYICVRTLDIRNIRCLGVGTQSGSHVPVPVPRLPIAQPE